MKSFRILLLLVLTLLAAGEALADSPGFLHLGFLEGGVQIKMDDASEWVPASVNTPLDEGHRIWAPAGARAELMARDGSSLRLDADTSLDILRLDDRVSHYYLNTGRVYVRFQERRGSSLRMETPDAVLTIVEPSILDIRTSDREACTTLSVFSGAVRVGDGEQRTVVGAGRTVFLYEDGYAEYGALESSDAWIRWNQSRDRRYAHSGASSRYLPDELQWYAGDLDEYGRWVHTHDYGYVWTPLAAVSPDWAPYRVGRWVWIGNDYQWVSYEPWGWTPHHYGRWSFVPSIGWCWVPPARGAVYWGPGYVGWVYTATIVSWVPLAPREIYFGYGSFGPYSEDLRKSRKGDAAHRIIYKNIQVNQGITVVHRDAFVYGRQISVDDREPQRLFQRGDVHLGHPEIRPENPTRMPVVREVPRRELPPPRVREMNVSAPRERRPSIRQERATQPLPMPAGRSAGEKRRPSAKPVSPAVMSPRQAPAVQTPPPPPTPTVDRSRKPADARIPERGAVSVPVKPASPSVKSPERPSMPQTSSPPSRRTGKPMEATPPEGRTERIPGKPESPAVKPSGAPITPRALPPVRERGRDIRENKPFERSPERIPASRPTDTERPKAGVVRTPEQTPQRPAERSRPAGDLTAPQRPVPTEKVSPAPVKSRPAGEEKEVQRSAPQKMTDKEKGPPRSELRR